MMKYEANMTGEAEDGMKTRYRVERRKEERSVDLKGNIQVCTDISEKGYSLMIYVSRCHGKALCVMLF